MYGAHTVSTSIVASPEAVYKHAADPSNLPVWAPGFVKSIGKRGNEWIAETSLGEVRFLFAPTNDFGVPGVSDQEFQQDMNTIRADLGKLRTVLEHQSGSAA